MRRHFAWMVALALAASPALAEDGKTKVPAKKGGDAAAKGGLPGSPEMMKRLLEKYDLNKDGQLSAAEKAKAQEDFLKSQGLQDFLKKFDKDGDGQLNDRERMAAMAAAERLRGQGGGGAVGGFGGGFGAAAGGGSGNAVPAEKPAKKKRPKQADVIKEFDKDGDGKLNDEEKAAARKAAKERKKSGE